MAEPIQLQTEDKLEYQFHPNASGFLQFRVKASNDAHVCLTTGPFEADPMVEVFIGGWGNTKSVIRRNRTKPDVAEADTPDILNGGEFRGFWIRWRGGVIEAGKEGESSPFLSWTDPSPISGISHVGVCTGWGCSGSWLVERAGSASGAGVGAGAHSWVGGEGGAVPEGALHAATDNGEPVYVARARHESGALIPGKLVPSHGCCYISWGGAEIPVGSYEVLCCEGGAAVWVGSAGGAEVGGAVAGGETEDGEPLYVGRAVPDGGEPTPGKVQPSHAVCYLPYGGQELAFPEYEVLVIH